MPEVNVNLKPEDDYVNTYYPGTMDSATAAPVQVRSGVELRGIDIKMVKARVVRVRGAVTGIGARPPMGTFLFMTPKDRGWGGGMDTRQAMVDAKGTFEFRGVTAGQYTLVARFNVPDGQLTSVQTVNVSDQPVTGLQLVLKPGGAISGSVTIEEEEANQAKAEPRSMPLTVHFQPVDQGGFGFGGGTAQVREDGTFTAKDVQPGRYRVMVYGGGAGYLKSARLGAEDAMTELEVPDGDVSGTLEIVMSRRAPRLVGPCWTPRTSPCPARSPYCSRRTNTGSRWTDLA